MHQRVVPQAAESAHAMKHCPRLSPNTAKRRRGLTFGESLLAVAAATMLATAAVPLTTHYCEAGRAETTRQALAQLRDAIVRVSDTREGLVPAPSSLAAATSRENNAEIRELLLELRPQCEMSVRDGWGRAIVLQNPGRLASGSQDVRLVSAGPNGRVEIDPHLSSATVLATPARAGDDLWVSFELP
jgi:hypothetical protein